MNQKKMTEFANDDIAWLDKIMAKKEGENSYRIEEKQGGFMKIIAVKGGGYFVHVQCGIICGILFDKCMIDAILAAAAFFHKKAKPIDSFHELLAEKLEPLIKEKYDAES